MKFVIYMCMCSLAQWNFFEGKKEKAFEYFEKKLNYIHDYPRVAEKERK